MWKQVSIGCTTLLMIHDCRGNYVNKKMLLVIRLLFLTTKFTKLEPLVEIYNPQTDNWTSEIPQSHTDFEWYCCGGRQQVLWLLSGVYIFSEGERLKFLTLSNYTVDSQVLACL